MFHLVTGGSGSGKSAFAEDRICECQKNVKGSLFYIATMLPYGEETKKKIMRHRNMRADKGFRTIECFTGLKYLEQNESALKNGWLRATDKCVLLECMSNLAANEIYQQDGAGKNTVEAVIQGIDMLKAQCRHLVIVTNEVCSECAIDSEEMREYKQILAAINCRLAEMADAVTEVVYGIPVTQKLFGKVGNHIAAYPVKTKNLNICESIELGSRKQTEKTDRGELHMKLIIGGAYQGKLTYAKRKYGERNWIDGESCAFEELDTCGGIYHFELYLRRMMEAGKDTAALVKSLAVQNRDIVIVSNEIGYGLVPVEAFEREYREQAGRVCTELAKLACSVDRVVCGIGLTLKGEERGWNI